MMLAWPRPGQRWSAGRGVGAAGLTALALLSKETWVITPGLVCALEFGFRKTDLRRALRTALPFLAVALAYAAVYFLAFPGGKNYYEGSLRPLLKVPHQLAAFLALEGLAPVAFPLSVAGVVAVVVVVFVVLFTLRRHNQAAIVGAALLLLPMLPTLLVPYLPTRYTSIPYAGFLLLFAGAAQELVKGTRVGWRAVEAAAVVVVLTLVLVAGVLAVRADLSDLRRVSEAHRTLLAEARACRDDFPLQRPVLVVRQESDNPLREITTSPLGMPKLLFVRHWDPSGLADAGALVEWVLGREDMSVRRFDDGEERFRDGGCRARPPHGFSWPRSAPASAGWPAPRGSPLAHAIIYGAPPAPRGWPRRYGRRARQANGAQRTACTGQQHELVRCSRSRGHRPASSAHHRVRRGDAAPGCGRATVISGASRADRPTLSCSGRALDLEQGLDEQHARRPASAKRSASSPSDRRFPRGAAGPRSPPRSSRCPRPAHRTWFGPTH
jgi:hypothetical protein